MAGGRAEINSGLGVSFDFAVRDGEKEPECDINRVDEGCRSVILEIVLCSANQETASKNTSMKLDRIRI